MTDHSWIRGFIMFYICAGLSWNRARNFQSVHLEGDSLKNVGSFYAWIFKWSFFVPVAARG